MNLFVRLGGLEIGRVVIVDCGNTPSGEYRAFDVVTPDAEEPLRIVVGKGAGKWGVISAATAALARHGR